jgi:hypothetical protein
MTLSDHARVKFTPQYKLERKYNVSIAFQKITYNHYMSTRKHRSITTVQYYLPVTTAPSMARALVMAGEECKLRTLAGARGLNLLTAPLPGS